jgi:hypothetical protein
VIEHKRDKDEPKGGWLGPPPTRGLAPIATATGTDKKGRWIFKPNKLTAKQQKAHKKFQKAMAKADKKGKWRFSW